MVEVELDHTELRFTSITVLKFNINFIMIPLVAYAQTNDWYANVY